MNLSSSPTTGFIPAGRYPYQSEVLIPTAPSSRHSPVVLIAVCAATCYFTDTVGSIVSWRRVYHRVLGRITAHAGFRTAQPAALSTDVKDCRCSAHRAPSTSPMPTVEPHWPSIAALRSSCTGSAPSQMPNSALRNTGPASTTPNSRPLRTIRTPFPGR